MVVLQGLADFIDGVVLFPEAEDEISGGGLFWSGSGSGLGSSEKNGVGIAAEVMAEDMEGADGVTEVTGGHFGREVIDEIGAEGFIEAVFGMSRLEEEAADYN